MRGNPAGTLGRFTSYRVFKLSFNSKGYYTLQTIEKYAIFIPKIAPKVGPKTHKKHIYVVKHKVG